MKKVVKLKVILPYIYPTPVYKFLCMIYQSFYNYILNDFICMQGCGNTMPDLSDMVPFYSGQVENFYLLVIGQVQVY